MFWIPLKVPGAQATSFDKGQHLAPGVIGPDARNKPHCFTESVQMKGEIERRPTNSAVIRKHVE
jgi:hypothetical protein